MSRFKVGDVIISPDNKTEFHILGVRDSEESVYYWLVRQGGIPCTYASASLHAFRLKPQFFEVGDEFEYSGWGYRVTHVDASPLSAWAIVTELNSGDQQRDTLAPYDFERFGKLIKKG